MTNFLIIYKELIGRKLHMVATHINCGSVEIQNEVLSLKKTNAEQVKSTLDYSFYDLDKILDAKGLKIQTK